MAFLIEHLSTLLTAPFSLLSEVLFLLVSHMSHTAYFLIMNIRSGVLVLGQDSNDYIG